MKQTENDLEFVTDENENKKSKELETPIYRDFEQSVIDSEKKSRDERKKAEEKKKITTPLQEANIADAEFNYVVPKESWKTHHKKSVKYHKNKRLGKKVPVYKVKSKEAAKASEDDVKKMTEDFVYARPHMKKEKRKRKKMSKGLKTAGIIIGSILGVILVAVATIFTLNQVGKSQMLSLDKDNLDITVPEYVEDIMVKSSNGGQTIEYDGKFYAVNKQIASLLFIGLDQNTTEATDENADALYLMAIDMSSKKVKVLCISRDTMTDIDIYDSTGKFIETKKKQVCLAMGYGDTPEARSENVVKSVRRILYNLPISSYFTIDLTCISTLNDAVGGVEVTSLIDFTSPEDKRKIHEGDLVTLHGREAEKYVRSRDLDPLDANAPRMERQQQYLKAFMSSVIPAAKNDISVISDLYSTITTHSVTDLTVPKILYMSSSALSLVEGVDDIEFINIKGTYEKGTNAEFYPDSKDLLEKMLYTFYVES